MSADERPVEELIGWTWDPERMWWTDASGEVHTDSAEADDLAAWLDAWWVEHVIETDRSWDDRTDWGGSWWGLVHDESDDGWLFWYVEPIDLDPDDDAHPSIRGALVAAVRKVAGVRS